MDHSSANGCMNLLELQIFLAALTSLCSFESPFTHKSIPYPLLLQRILGVLFRVDSSGGLITRTPCGFSSSVECKSLIQS